MKLYAKYFSLHLRCAMQYKMSFLLTIVGQFLTAFSVLIGILFMFMRFKSVEGFTFSEVLLCFSIVLMSFSLAEAFFRGFDSFRSTIANGEFDRILVRPRSVMFQVLASKIEFTRLGRLLEAAAVLCYAIPCSGISWTLFRVLTLLFMIVGGAALFAALFIVYASFCFFTLEGLEFMNIFTDGGREFGRYPFSVYGKKALLFFSFAVPLACVQYYPLMLLFGHSRNPLLALCPLAGFAFLLPASAFWRFGVGRYRSTGS